MLQHGQDARLATNNPGCTMPTRHPPTTRSCPLPPPAEPTNRPYAQPALPQELCEKALAAQSHSAPKILNFHHLAPAAMALRIGLTLFWLRVERPGQVGGAGSGLVVERPGRVCCGAG